MSDVPAHLWLNYPRSGTRGHWFTQAKLLAGSTLGGNGLALVGGSAISSVLGLLFWLVVARGFSQAEVGIGAALVASMTALSHAAQFNLRNLIHRFVPMAGRSKATLINRAYAGAAAGALVLGCGFVLVVGYFVPELAFIGQSFWLAAGFVAALTVWTLYALQEAVLTGLRLSKIVPVQSLAYSTAKIALVLIAGLWASAWAVGGLNILGIWIVPAALIGLYVHRHIRRELQRSSRPDTPDHEILDRAAFLRFFGWDYLGSLAASVAYGVVPLLVLSMAGGAASAQYQMAWMVAYSLYLAGRHFGAAMQAEIGSHPLKRRGLYASAMVYTLGCVTPAVMVITIFAPQIMALFGTDYVDEGGLVLRLLAIATLPLSVITVMLAIARAENYFFGVAAVQVSTLVLATGSGSLLLASMGTAGMAWAWLMTHSLVLAAALVWLSIKAGPGGVKTALIDFVSAIGRLRAIAALAWPRAAQPSLSDVHTEVGRVVSKRSDTAQGRGALDAEFRALDYLNGDERLQGFHLLVPEIVSFDGKKHLQTSRLLGTEGRNLSGDESRAGMLAARKIAGMHRATSHVTTIGSEWLNDWVETPLGLLNLSAREVGHIRSLLIGAFDGTRTELGLGHGDFCLDNLIFEPDRAKRKAVGLTGIVDWGQSRMDAPALADPLHLVMTTRMRTRDQEFGQVVADLLSDAHLSPDEETIAGTNWKTLTAEERRASILLVWLMHVANNIAKSDRYHLGRYWRWANVQLVVDAVNAGIHAANAARTQPRRQPAVAETPVAKPRPVWLAASTLGLLVAGLAIWVLNLQNVQVGNMGDLGLITILPNAMAVAYAIVIAGFVLSVSGETPMRVAPMLFLAGLVLLLHATPAISYETLRYSWAWKHVGVIDYIMRTGQLDPTAQFLSAYFNWPLFFIAAAAAANALGLDALEIASLARFFPVLLNICYAFLLFGIFGNLGADRRAAYVGIGLFLLGNWVGQDYFSPQGSAFLFYLCVIYLVTGPLAQNLSGWRSGLVGTVEDRLEIAVRPGSVEERSQWAPLHQISVLVLTGLIIATHQLTPLLLLSGLFGLFVIGRLRIEYFVFALVAQLLWLFYFADSFMAGALADIIDSFGAVGGDTVGRLVDLDVVSDSQRMVSLASRGLSAGIILLGLIGGLVRLWRRQLDLTALVLLLAPVPLVFATPYGGEVVFRTYFFALPFIAFFAAAIFAGTAKMGVVRGLVLALVMLLMVPGFILANNGKDQQYRFTTGEVAAADWLYSRARPGELLVEGSRSYPSQFRNYENFIYVPLSEELPEIAPELTSDPSGLAVRWLSRAPNGGYIIITRSMKAMFDSLGLLPTGGLERVEQALYTAPQLKVAFSNADAVIFTLRDEPGSQ